MPSPRSRTIAAAALAGVVLTACGSGPGTADDAGAAEDTTQEEAAGGTDGALLGIIEPGVDVADEPADPVAAAFRTGEDGEGLVVGDLVRTDEAGFAEVAWFDGALARVDADTLYALAEFDTAPGEAVVVTDLDVGRIWNRLQPDVAATYEVVTDVGTAAVRGTAFWVACDDACTFAVLEGTVEVATTDGTVVTLEAGQQVTVDGDGEPDEVAATDVDDPWVVRNAELDEDAGFDALEEPEPVLACPLVDVPDGWVLEPPEDPAAPAARFCRYVRPDAAVPQFAEVVWNSPDAEQLRETIDRNRPYFEETRDRIAGQDCSEGMREVHTAIDEPLGAGHLHGFSWYVARGPLPPSFDVCTDDGGASQFYVIIDGQAFALRGAEGLAPCQRPQATQTAGEWNAYVECRFAQHDALLEEYRALAATLLGG